MPDPVFTSRIEKTLRGKYNTDKEEMARRHAGQKRKMKTAGEKEITMKFDGEEVPMAPFIEEMVSGVILGMVRALKGYEEGMDVTIEIK